MTFESPALLCLLALVILQVWRFGQLRGRSAIRFSSVSQVPYIAKSSQILQHVGPVLRCLALSALVVAIARPQSALLPSAKTSEGIDIVLALDTSGSMQALDFELDGERMNRLAVVKRVIDEFIDSRIGDRIGMVIFGTEAFTQAPLTLDHKLLHRFVEKIKIGMAGDATAIGDALATATKRIKDIDAKSKVVILLTDGSSNAGKIDPIAAAESAAGVGVKVYTIGVGTKGKAPMPVRGIFGESIQYVDVDIDEDVLTKIAAVSGGQYFRAYDTKSLREIYKTIDRLEKRRIESVDYRARQELFMRFLMVAIGAILAEMVWSTSRFRRVPA